MAVRVDASCWGAEDPVALATFWAGVLRRETAADGVTLRPDEDAGVTLRFRRSGQPRRGLNQVHLHVTSAAPGDQQATIDRARSLGGHHLDVGQTPDEGHVVLADPEGNEFCVIEAGNRFLAGTGALGELAGDGTRAVGLFWAEVLGWPLVWDQDEETSVQSPRGGTKISWGGPPVRTRTAENRMHLDVAADDVGAELDRLLALGGTRTDVSCDRAGTGLADPDGNELHLLG